MTWESGVVLVDDNGREFRKPDRSVYASDAEYMRACYEAKQAIANEANRAFAVAFSAEMARGRVRP